MSCENESFLYRSFVLRNVFVNAWPTLRHIVLCSQHSIGYSYWLRHDQIFHVKKIGVSTLSCSDTIPGHMAIAYTAVGVCLCVANAYAPGSKNFAELKRTALACFGKFYSFDSYTMIVIYCRYKRRIDIFLLSVNMS